MPEPIRDRVRTRPKRIALGPWVGWLVGALGLGVAVAVVLGYGDLVRLVEVLQRIQLKWLALAGSIQAVTYVCSAAIWRQVLKRWGRDMPFATLLPLSLAQLFVRQAVPSNGLSGSMLTATGLLNRGVAQTEATACLMLSLVSYYAAYFIAACAAFLIIAAHYGVHTRLELLASCFVLVVVAVPSVVFLLRWMRRHDKIPAWGGRVALFRKPLDNLARFPMELLKDWRLMLETTGLQLAIFAIDAWTLRIMLQAVGVQEPFGPAYCAFIMASIVATLAPVPLGLGTFEGTCVAVLHRFGVPIEAALVATLLLRGFTFWLPMIPGFWLARRELKRAA
jgi:uncharacterized protein (TIRG00374 family)